MMVFLAKGSKTYKVRVDHPDGRHAVLSTGCIIREDADDIEEIIHRWQGRKGKKFERRDVLDALIEKRITLTEAVEASQGSTLDALLDAHQPGAVLVDLVPLVQDWLADKRKAKRGAEQADIYARQFNTLFPERPLYLTHFTRKEVWARLDRLDVAEPTKIRYRAATSSLAKFLVKREILETNFVRDIVGYAENDPRLVYYEVPDARKLIEGLEQLHAAIAAMGLGFCAEFGAMQRSIVSDFDLDANPPTARVRGTKRSWRDRVIPLVPQLAWVVDFIQPCLANKLSGALVFDGVTEWIALDRQREAADALKIVAIGEDEFGQHGLHDWRHTHAVALLRWGYDEQIVANHLGHKNTTLVRERYGRFKPTRLDYAKVAAETPAAATAPIEASAITKSITSAKSAKSRRAVGGGK